MSVFQVVQAVYHMPTNCMFFQYPGCYLDGWARSILCCLLKNIYTLAMSSEIVDYGSRS